MNKELGVEIDLTTLDTQSCECGSMLFVSAVIIKRISMFHPANKSGVDKTLPLDVIVCKSCGLIPGFISSKMAGVIDEKMKAKKIVS